MDAARYLIVVADDFGIGPETSRGILELAGQRRLDATVLLVNSPHAADAVARWRADGQPVELGWHPNLTLDRSCAPRQLVPSLVQGDGTFHPLGSFLRRLLLGQVRRADLETELRAQFLRFIELVGHPPPLVNSHQHVALFRPVGDVLLDVLEANAIRPYFRNVVESWGLFWRVGGARLKRLVLTWLGRSVMRRAQRRGFHGADFLLGLTNSGSARRADCFARWLRAAPGRCVELMCHPGYTDETLLGRDARPGDGWLEQRRGELELLRGEAFPATCQAAGLTHIAPSQFGEPTMPGLQENGPSAA
jgi:predicted glycoside hydrolase/deacetylase ChbG (UPF0249 family)